MQTVHRRDGLSFLRKDKQMNVAFFPDGKKLTTSGTVKRVYISDVKSGDWDHIVWVKPYRAATHVSPDGKYIAIFGPPNEREISGQLNLFKVRRGLQPMWTRKHDGTNAVTTVVFSANSDRVASGGSGDGVRVWDVKSGKAIAHFARPTKARTVGFAFRNNGQQLIMAAEDHLQLIEIKSAKALTSQSLKTTIRRFSAAGNGAMFVTSGSNASLKLWTIKD